MWSVKTSAWSVSGLRKNHRFERALRHAAKQHIFFSLASKKLSDYSPSLRQKEGELWAQLPKFSYLHLFVAPFPDIFFAFSCRIGRFVSGAFQGRQGWKYKVFRKNTTNSVRYAVSDSGDMRSLVFQVFLRLQS